MERIDRKEGKSYVTFSITAILVATSLVVHVLLFDSVVNPIFTTLPQISPPFVPEISSETDTRYFDRQFTQEPVNLTPIDRPLNHLSEVDASFFTQFSFAAGSQLSRH